MFSSFFKRIVKRKQAEDTPSFMPSHLKERKRKCAKKAKLDDTGENESILTQKKAIAASYTVSHLIGKSKAAYSVGEH